MHRDPRSSPSVTASEIVATAAAPTVKNHRRHRAGLVAAGVGQVHLRAAGQAGGHPEHGPRLPLHLLLLLPVEVLARLPGAGSDQGRRRNRNTRERAWTSGSSSLPTRSRPSIARSSSRSARNSSIADSRQGVQWGINTRVTDILRDEKLLPLYRKAGSGARQPRHRGRGADEARSLQQGNQDRAQSSRHRAAARRRHLRRGAVHRRPRQRNPETLEETYQMAWDWQPDLANWAMYTPWPFTPLFRNWVTRSRFSTSRSTTSSRRS